MSLSIFISQRAEEDLALQHQWYLKEAGADVAESYLLAVDETLRMLATQPDIGFLRRFKATELQGVRSIAIRGSFRRHLIFYRDGERLSIERVMHGARDLPQRLLE